MRISALEIQILNELLAGEMAPVASSHRLRLEMMGLVRDTRAGLVLTEAGKLAAAAQPTVVHEAYDRLPEKVDAAGRRVQGHRWR
jgi:hypothetical protein